MSGKKGPCLPSRKQGHFNNEVLTTQQVAEQAASLLTDYLDKGHWSSLALLFEVLNAFIDNWPTNAFYLAAVELASIAAGALQRCPKLAPARPWLQAAAFGMLLRLLKTDERTLHHVLNRKTLSVLISAMSLGGPSGPMLARQNAAAVILFLSRHNRSCKEALVDSGALPVLVLLLHDLPSICDLNLVQDALWSVINLAEVLSYRTSSTATSADITESLPPSCVELVKALGPLIHVYQLPEAQEISHMLALVIRSLHVLLTGDDESKEALRAMGAVRSLVTLIRTSRELDVQDLQEHETGLRHSADGKMAAASILSKAGLSAAGQAGWSQRFEMEKLLLKAQTEGPERYHTHTNGGSSKEMDVLLKNVSPWQRFLAALILRAVLEESNSENGTNFIMNDHGQEAKSDDAAQLNGEITQEILESETPSKSLYLSPCSSLPSYGLLLSLLPFSLSKSAEPMCPLREAVATLRALLSDSPDNQAEAVQEGVVSALVHLLATADISLAWQACEVVSTLGPQYSEQLLQAGAAEELALLLQESADALHLLTVQRQLHQRMSGLGPTQHAPSPLQPEIEGDTLQMWRANGRQLQDQYKKKKARIQLVGRQAPLNFQTYSSSKSCMYAAGHGTATFCDYCVPSSVIKALLRISNEKITVATRGEGSSKEYMRIGSLAERFADTGGVYTLFLLLHHEVAGVAHSKLASSAISLLNLVLESSAWSQDDVRQVRGLSVLTSLLSSLLRPGVADIYQLRVSVCMAIKAVIQGNPANRLLAREQNLFSPLIQLLRMALGMPTSIPSPLSTSVSTDGQHIRTSTISVQKQASKRTMIALTGEAMASNLLDAEEQVAVAAMETLSACLPGSSGNQEALVALGGTKLLYDLLMSNGHTPATYAAAIQLLVALCECNVNAQLVVTGSGLLGRIGQFPQGSGYAGPLAASYCMLISQLLRFGPSDSKSRILATGGLSTLLFILSHRPADHATAEAAGVLRLLLASGDVDLQNEVAAQGGGLYAVFDLTANWHGPITHAVLQLLPAMAKDNTYVKNMARQGGLISLLMAVMKGCTSTHASTAVHAARALTCLVQSNHANQDKVAEEGGIEIIADLLEGIIAPIQHSLESLAMAGQGDGEAAMMTNTSNKAGLHTDSKEASSYHGMSVGSPQATAVMQSLVAGDSRSVLSVGSLRRGRVSGTGGGMKMLHNPGQLAAHQNESVSTLGGTLSGAVMNPDVLDALFALLGALVEFNDTNQQTARESGCLTLLLHLLRSVSSVPISPDDLARARLIPAVASACYALARLVQDCPESQLRLAGGGGDDLDPILFNLLSFNDPLVALEASKTMEYILCDGRDMTEHESDTVKALVRVLYTRGDAEQAQSGASTQQAQSGGVIEGNFKKAVDAAFGVSDPVSPFLVKEAADVLQRITEAAAAALHEPSDLEHIDAVAEATGAGSVNRRGVMESATTLSFLPGFKGSSQPTASSHTLHQKPVGDVLRVGMAPAEGSDSASTRNTKNAAAPNLLLQPIPASFEMNLRADAGRDSPASQASHEASRTSFKMTASGTGVAAASGAGDDVAQQQVETSKRWQRLVGRSAPAFQAVSSTLSEGPWKAVKLQVSWILFLLSVRSQSNRELILRLRRTTLLPLIQQLENAAASQLSLLQALDMQQELKSKEAVAPRRVPGVVGSLSPALLLKGRGHKSIQSERFANPSKTDVDHLPVSTPALESLNSVSSVRSIVAAVTEPATSDVSAQVLADDCEGSYPQQASSITVPPVLSDIEGLHSSVILEQRLSSVTNGIDLDTNEDGVDAAAANDSIMSHHNTVHPSIVSQNMSASAENSRQDVMTGPGTDLDSMKAQGVTSMIGRSDPISPSTFPSPSQENTLALARSGSAGSHTGAGGSPMNRKSVMSDEEDWELSMIRQEVAMLASRSGVNAATGAGGGGGGGGSGGVKTGLTPRRNG
ncbi:hypothetical protein CEUSTIGMA_g9615.t1 [Chlamydomonas eustigma]|uniref:Armadillo-type fold n=1 Tax=Chlamydomonas eustigma TaxID=1157962 RepID=A0A250XGJ1_9CHLO|nr:hypothetical protein CEUSTIGMA_g9615.t1 [Chlamydomonas eustigma]|eukprot:GAX82187.1 hypothetical protein CEUSTIGMA_g9615.t1 [Chlamydomonas eustigma]